MKLIPPSADSLKEAMAILRSGGVVAHPADTCFGLAGDLMNPETFQKIQAIKGRDADKPMSIMLPVIQKDRLEDYVVMSEFAMMVADRLMPGPVTLLLPKGPKIPDFYFPGHQLIGVRIPMHELTQDLLTYFNGPLITTSANLSGEPLCFYHAEVIDYFDDQPTQPDLVIEGQCDEHQKASTVLKVLKDSVQIYRDGPLGKHELEALLGCKVLI